MAYIGQKPADKPLGASDITDGIISNSKLAQDIISAETELATAPADTDEFLISDAGVLKRLDASLVGGGTIEQLVSTSKTNSFNTTSTSLVDVTGLSLSITPSSSSNKVFIIGNIQTNEMAGEILTIQLVRGSTEIAKGTDSKTFVGTVANYNAGTSDNHALLNNSFSFLDSPSTTSATTYKIQVKCNGGGNLYVNNRLNNDASYISTITAMEIKV